MGFKEDAQSAINAGLSPEKTLDALSKNPKYANELTQLKNAGVSPDRIFGFTPTPMVTTPEGTKPLTKEDITMQKDVAEGYLGGISMGLVPYLARKTGLVPPSNEPVSGANIVGQVMGGIGPGLTSGVVKGTGSILSKLIPARPILKAAIEGGVTGLAYTPQEAQQTGEGFFSPGTRAIQAGVGVVTDTALTALLKGIGLFKNIRNIDKELYPKTEKAITKAYKTMHSNINSDLVALPTAYPNRVIIPENTYDVVAKYVTLDKKTLTAIKSIPELNKFLRSKVPGEIKTPLEAQTLKNKIREKLGVKAASGEISIGKKELADLFEAIDTDITNAYPEAYPQIKAVYKDALDALDIIDPLRNRANFKSELMKAQKGTGQAMQAALSKLLPPDLANELITYASVPVKATKILEKTIRPKNVKPVLKRVVKNPPRG